ncbi:aminotransferase [Coleophoma cylindrospora]|uniref:Aminotransferase n=1 Tax=Coleophoma cylindrospora TaxID=1849047 RepID=A0A3D8QNQ7_9HELO|nr:aminotransferase [Coleophoma cylindrospora]
MATSIQNFVTIKAGKLRLSPTLEINELVQATRAKGNKVVHLGFGEATFPVQKDVLAAHEQHSRSTSYMPVAGALELRQAIAEYNARRYGIQIEADQVVVAPGSKPLLFALFDILKGDVLLPRPSWVSYEPQIQLANKRHFWVETDEHDRHSITFEALDAAYKRALEEKADPRIMLINSPSNPTGQVFSPPVLTVISTFCQDKGIVLISDEIYSDLTYDQEANPISAFQISNAITGDARPSKAATPVIITSGLSKTYSAGGWRVGYAIFPHCESGRHIRDTTLAYASECWSAASAPAQLASIEALGTSCAMNSYRRMVTSLHSHCTTRLYEALRDLGLNVAEPKGAFYVYPSFQPYSAQLEKLNVRTSVELSQWLISECGVAALPGSAFGEADDGLVGGRLRLRMATSYLYFQSEADRYEKGYAMLERAGEEQELYLPLLDEAILSLQGAVQKLRDTPK